MAKFLGYWMRALGLTNEVTVQLYLYKSQNKEWMKHYSIAKIYCTMAIEWLYYYEICQMTGEW